jgi:hypothetical protein
MSSNFFLPLNALSVTLNHHEVHENFSSCLCGRVCSCRTRRSGEAARYVLRLLCLLEHKLINATKLHHSLNLLQALLPLTVSTYYPTHFLHCNLTRRGSWIYRLRGDLCCQVVGVGSNVTRWRSGHTSHMYVLPLVDSASQVMMLMV